VQQTGGSITSNLRDREGDRLRLNFHSGQLRVWDSTARFVVMLAGTQGGKTCFGPHWLHREILRKGDGDYLAVTATYPLLKLKMLPEFLTVFHDILKLGVYKEADKVFLFHDGKTRIIFASAINPESIESATAKAAWLDEAGQKQFKREAWEAIQRRLSINQGRVLITTTLYGIGWLKSEFYDKGKNGDKNIDIIQFDSIVNPMFPKEEYDRARSVLPSWKFNLFYRGEYDKAAGLIYDSFDDACIIPRIPIYKEWPVYVGHDFGGVNPAAVFYAHDPSTGYFYAFAEYRPNENKTTAEQVNDFKAITTGYNVIKRAGGAHSEEGWRNDYTSHGWPILEPKIRDVEVGIEKVYGLHRLNKIFVFSDLHEYIKEKQSYSRELDDDYDPIAKIESKSKYHLMDAERYILSDFTPETAVSQRPVTKKSFVM